MAKANVTLAVRKVKANAAVIDIQGEINAFAEGALMDAYNEASSDQVQNILLNFSGLDYMNSSGIGLLVTLLIRVQRQKQTLMAFGLSDHYKQIFDLTRLNEAIHIYPDETAALAATG
jgi:anti-sigma B factor antagonist